MDVMNNTEVQPRDEIFEMGKEFAFEGLTEEYFKANKDVNIITIKIIFLIMLIDNFLSVFINHIKSVINIIVIRAFYQRCVIGIITCHSSHF